MSHVYHPDLPGFSEENILQDGCPECEHRSRKVNGILDLDPSNLFRLWRKLMARERDEIPAMSECDARLVDGLYEWFVIAERCGFGREEIGLRLEYRATRDAGTLGGQAA